MCEREGRLQTRRTMGIGREKQNMRASRRETEDWDSHQNTVCLRVSQLEGVAETATRPNPLKKRMTGNLSRGRITESHARA